LPDGVVNLLVSGSRICAAKATASSGAAKRATPFSANVSKSATESRVSSRSHSISVFSA
jgi:hypothetical protein